MLSSLAMRSGLRVIPVLDLKGGVAVHAVRGERRAYAPGRSVLSPSAAPIAPARAFHGHLGSDPSYVADLDALRGAGRQGAVVAAIASLGLAVGLDAGVATAADARRAASGGVARVIVGTETLRDAGDLPAIAQAARQATATGVDCIL